MKDQRGNFAKLLNISLGSKFHNNFDQVGCPKKQKYRSFTNSRQSISQETIKSGHLQKKF